jgi:hypothetical protein
MPSTIADFASNTRLLKPSIAVDLDNNAVAEDWTNNLDNYSILHSLDGQVAGIVDIQLDAEFYVPAASSEWAKPGKLTNAKIQISNDNYATNYEATLFTGSTVGSNSVPYRDVKIKATGYNTDYLDKRATRRVYISQDISTILTQILTDVGVSGGSISLTSTGYVVPVYIVSDNFPARRYIDDLAKAGLLVVGFDRDGIFRARSILKLDFTSPSYSPDVTVLLDQTINFPGQIVRSGLYCNSVKVTGSQLTYLQNQQIFFDTSITGQEIKPSSRLIFSLPLGDVYPEVVNPFKSRPTAGYSFAVYNGLQSWYSFYTSDDTTATINNANIQFVSGDIVPGSDGTENYLLVFQNTSSTNSYWLKAIFLNGSAVKRINTFSQEYREEAKIQNDGKEIPLELESMALYDDIQTDRVLNLIRLNNMSYADLYKVEVKGRPDIVVGSIVSIRNISDVAQLCSVVEIDENVGTDGYEQTLTCKKIATGSSYFAVDISGLGVDTSGVEAF